MNLLPLLTALFTQYLTQNAPNPDPQSGAASAKTMAAENFAQVQEKIKDHDQFWSAPFVIADTEKKEVTVWGQHTGMSVGEPLEFFVIAENSGHDYESLMLAFAKPGDIHQALEKIGMKAGGSVSPDRHRFWPRGSRIVAEIEWQPDEAGQPIRMPIEQTARHLGAPMQPIPWVFTGAPMLPDPENGNDPVYAADVYSPNSIASTFNLANTVFDLPFQGGKTQTYGNFLRTGTHRAPEGKPMLLHLRPARADEVPKEVDLRLQFRGPDGSLSVTGMDNLPDGGLAELGAFLNQRTNEVFFLQPDFGPELPLTQTARLARELELLETHVPGVRIEPPLPGQLFYRAFLPDPRFRNREARPSQPLELHLTSQDATLITLEEIWGDAPAPNILEKRSLLGQPEDLRTALQNPDIRKPVLFVYSQGQRTHQDLIRWIGPVLQQFPIVYVFLDEN